jgi:hemoglobin
MNQISETAPPSTPFELLGDQGVSQLVDAFYDAMEAMPQAEEIRKMHAANLTKVRRKLKSYLTNWLGGPPVYLAMHGTVCLTEPHAAFHIGPRQRDQWLECMDVALERIDASPQLKQMLKQPLQQIADTVRNQETSDPLPRDPNIIAVG